MSNTWLPSHLDADTRALLKTADELADAAAQITLKHFRTDGAKSENKSAAGADYDPVTIADRDAESAMRALLDKERPTDSVNGEEFGLKSGTSDWTWYLDPIDGTRAYVAGLTSWTTLIGITRDGSPEIGIIDQPWLGERYIGWTNGAVLRVRGETQDLRVREGATLQSSILATTDPFILTPSERGAFEHLRATARLTRYGLDAYAYARLAAGSIDIVTETGLHPHDIAALIPIVRGAGGLALDWTGKPAKLGQQLVCTSSQKVMDQALISLRRSAT